MLEVNQYAKSAVKNSIPYPALAENSVATMCSVTDDYYNVNSIGCFGAILLNCLCKLA